MMKTTNIAVAGLGGQGVITASDIIAEAAFRSGFDVKKAEIHGMSQRGGSVSTDIRFGREVLSPMIGRGEADVLVVVDPSQIPNNRHRRRPGGILIEPAPFAKADLPSSRTLNVAMLGALSRTIDAIPVASWEAAIRDRLPEKLHAMNLAAFKIGRETRIQP